MKTDKRQFKPDNDSRIARYIKVQPQTIYVWKKDHPEKYELIKLGWMAKCREINAKL